MRPGNIGKSLVLAFAIAAGVLVLALYGERHADRVDVVKSLSISPVQVTRLNALDARS